MRSVRAPLIDAETLAGRIGRSSLVVLDASAAPPGTSHDPSAAFRDAHLPGAQRFDLDLFSDPEGDAPHTLPSATRFARLAGELGIGDDATVVVYEAGRLFAAARAWFLFRLFGHDDVLLLDGGLDAWRAHAGELERGDAAARPGARFTPRFRARLLAGLGDVVRPDTDRVLLDARPAARFAGTEPEPRPGIRSGRIPGSRNVPYDAVLDASGRLRDEQSLRELFGVNGVGPSTEVVTSCGTGVTAAILSLALAVAGLGEATLYDGSWTEYARSVPEPTSDRARDDAAR